LKLTSKAVIATVRTRGVVFDDSSVGLQHRPTLQDSVIEEETSGLLDSIRR
jgi:hypothetical protein